MYLNTPRRPDGVSLPFVTPDPSDEHQTSASAPGGHAPRDTPRHVRGDSGRLTPARKTLPRLLPALCNRKPTAVPDTHNHTVTVNSGTRVPGSRMGWGRAAFPSRGAAAPFGVGLLDKAQAAKTTARKADRLTTKSQTGRALGKRSHRAGVLPARTLRSSVSPSRCGRRKCPRGRGTPRNCSCRRWT